MAVNKVTFNTASGEEVLIDLTGDNATADVVFEGATFHGADGEKKAGTFTISSELTEQEALIEQIKAALQGKAAGGSGLPMQEKTVEVTSNATVEVLPDAGYTLSKVTANVNVPIPDGYIKPSGTLEVTENGEYDVGEYASVNVNVPTGGGDPKALLDASLNNTLTAIDSNVTSIVGYACRGLSKLKTVNLPNATSIGTYAFYYCTAMTSINAPKVTSLGTYAFYNSKLAKVNFPLATAVPQNAFYSCSSLETADFGAAKSIATSAFAYDAALKTLILRRTDAICTLANKNALVDTPIAEGNGYVYCPAALVDSYKAASNWSTYANQFRAIEDYPEITGGVTA